LSACAIAIMRRRRGVKLLTWLGIWSAIEGARYLFGSLGSLGVLPEWFLISFSYLDTVLSYLVVVVAVLAFLQLTQGKLRLFFQVAILVGLAMALAGVGFFVFTGARYRLMFYNHLFAVCCLAVLATVVAVPKLCRKFLILPNRGVLAVGIFLFSMEAVYGNLSGPLGFRSPPEILDPVGFALLLFCFGYAAVQRLETISPPTARGV
jgi:hypothetical protein